MSFVHQTVLSIPCPLVPTHLIFHRSVFPAVNLRCQVFLTPLIPERTDFNICLSLDSSPTSIAQFDKWVTAMIGVAVLRLGGLFGGAVCRLRQIICGDEFEEEPQVW